MSSVISNSLKNLSSFLQDHQVSFSNGLLILFTIGGEQIFRFNTFKCPCTHDEAFIYALIFLLAPALILGIIGVAVSNLTWRIFHGCRNRSLTAGNGCWKSTEYLIIAIARASVVPFAWLFVAFLDGNYFACMMAEKPCEKLADGRTDSEEIIYLKAVSQNIAWLSLGALILLSFIVICIVRCSDSVTYVQYKYLQSYREAEQEQMDKQVQECTKTMAESNVKVFIDKLQLNKNDWDNISRVPDKYFLNQHKKDEGDTFKRDFQKDPVFLTPLHEWVNKLSQMPQSQEQDLRSAASQEQNIS